MNGGAREMLFSEDSRRLQRRQWSTLTPTAIEMGDSSSDISLQMAHLKSMRTDLMQPTEMFA